MAKVKLSATLCLASLAFASPLCAAKLVNSLQPVVEDQIRRPLLAKSLEKALVETMADDSKIVLVQESDINPRFNVHLKLKRDDRFPDKEAIQCRFQNPGGQDRFLTLTFPKNLQDRDRRWISKKAAETISAQLKSESLVERNARLSPDMSLNIVHLNPKHRHLDIELMGKRHTGKALPDLVEPWQEQEKNIAQRSEPTVQRRSNPNQDTVLSFHRSPPAETIDPDNPPLVEKPYERAPIHPFKAQLSRELARQPNFKFPRFLTSGPVSLIYTPNLGLTETDPREHFNAEISTSYTMEHYRSASNDGLTKIRWEGDLLRYHLTLSTRLWNKFGITLDTGMGTHKSDIQLEAAHPTAPGGSTFLNGGALGLGMLDTTVTVNYLMENGFGLFRPHVTYKFPTGSTSNMLGSGQGDASAGASLEWSVNDWHLKGLMAYTVPGELDIFNQRQTPLKTNGYLYAGFGFGRYLNVWGGERVAMSLNFMENPMGRATDLDDLDQELVTLQGLVEKAFTPQLDLRLEASYGFSQSSPDGSILAALNFHF